VFQYLPALRDPQHEFSIRSKTWGRILRQMTLSSADRIKIEDAVRALNDLLVASDPRFGQLTGKIARIGTVVPLEGADPVSIRAAPTEPWELLARSELAIRGRGSSLQIPLLKHGLGVQSLAVLFLLEAYIDLALRQEFQPETEALVAIEEPESHLHPQAIHAFARYSTGRGFQIIITTHSPYFFATTPIESAIFLRSSGPTSEARFVRRTLHCAWPNSIGIVKMCSALAPKWSYDVVTQTLSLRGQMTDHELTSILALAPLDAPAGTRLRDLYNLSQAYLSDAELILLSQWASRMRGHVFFARSWLLCEGPSDYVVFQGLSELLGKSFEASGVSLIDFCNHGSVGPFVAVARHLGIPWVLTADGDIEGTKYAAEAARRATGDPDLAKRIRPLQPSGTVLEQALVRSALRPTVERSAQALGFSSYQAVSSTAYEAELIKFLLDNKQLFPHEFCRQLKASTQTSADVPAYFTEAIDLAFDLAR